ncbi:hypothetical protein LXL04_014227 [Taraxacum kok-saghyz]
MPYQRLRCKDEIVKGIGIFCPARVIAILSHATYRHQPDRRRCDEQTLGHHLHHSSFAFPPPPSTQAPLQFLFHPTVITITEHHVSFDPLVANIEGKKDDKLWEKSHFFNDHEAKTQSDADDDAPGMESQPEWEESIKTEDYLNDEHKFNITHILLLLFPRIDVDWVCD